MKDLFKRLFSKPKAKEDDGEKWAREIVNAIDAALHSYGVRTAWDDRDMVKVGQIWMRSEYQGVTASLARHPFLWAQVDAIGSNGSVSLKFLSDFGYETGDGFVPVTVFLNSFVPVVGEIE